MAEMQFKGDKQTYFQGLYLFIEVKYLSKSICFSFGICELNVLINIYDATSNGVNHDTCITIFPDGNIFCCFTLTFHTFYRKQFKVGMYRAYSYAHFHSKASNFSRILSLIVRRYHPCDSRLWKSHLYIFFKITKRVFQMLWNLMVLPLLCSIPVYKNSTNI